MKFWSAVAVGVIAFLAGTCELSAQGLVVSLVPPVHPVVREAQLKLDLLAVNPTAMEAPFDAPETLRGLLYASTRSWSVELVRDGETPLVVQPHGFAYRSYSLVLPPGAEGRLVLEISDGGYAPLRTVIATDANATKPTGASTSSLSTLDAATPAVAQLQRNFAGHFAPHDPIYIVYGTKAPGIKFQFSFKYRLLDFQGDSVSNAQRGLEFGYTQRSLWDVAGKSSPFYDTSYMPSLFYESQATKTENNRFGPISWVGYQIGYQHESNGQGLGASRSVNTLFVRPAFIVGAADGWHVVVAPRIWTYVGDLSNNPHLADYRGHGELLLVFGRSAGTALAYTGRAGREFDHFTSQLDLTVPVRLKLLDFASYFLVQYFNGYGESLRDYDKRSSVLRAGISLVR